MGGFLCNFTTLIIRFSEEIDQFLQRKSIGGAMLNQQICLLGDSDLFGFLNNTDSDGKKRKTLMQTSRGGCTGTFCSRIFFCKAVFIRSLSATPNHFVLRSLFSGRLTSEIRTDFVLRQRYGSVVFINCGAYTQYRLNT